MVVFERISYIPLNISKHNKDELLKTEITIYHSTPYNIPDDLNLRVLSHNAYTGMSILTKIIQDTGLPFNFQIFVITILKSCLHA